MKTLVIAGGVSANKKLRADLESALAKVNAKVFYARHEFCTDNGAMIAFAGMERFKLGAYDKQLRIIEPKARWPLNELC